MSLPCRFISVSAGTVTFVCGEGKRDESAALPMLVMDILAPVPLRRLRMRPEQEQYTPGGAWPDVRCGLTWMEKPCAGRGEIAAEGAGAAHWMYDAFSHCDRDLRGAGRGRNGWSGGWWIRVCGHVAGLKHFWQGAGGSATGRGAGADVC